LLIAARWLDPAIVGATFSYGSWNVVSHWEAALRRLAEALPILALIGLYAWCWSAMRIAQSDPARLRILAAATSAALVVLMTLGKLFSPQYVIWLLPAGVLAAAAGSRLSRLLLIAAVLMTQIIYPFGYFAFMPNLDPKFGLLILERNGLLMFWAVNLLIEARRATVRVAGGAARDLAHDAECAVVSPARVDGQPTDAS
jgi:hypothetical protein